MSRCSVCSIEGATELLLHSGESLGHAHEGDCQTLLWEARICCGRWHVVTGEEVAWAWRRRRAQVRGEAFREPPPKLDAERELDAAIAVRGWDDIARELE